jgi:hypothetical protein
VRLGQEINSGAFTIWFANASGFLGHFWATFSVVVGCDELQPKNAMASKIIANH